ncbi:prepilin peptidase [Sphingorhabdus arenilitoris]|uniref:Prepilin peptidase n=1 Tax=Sphingorhabdus arenilitoris TaxID=1490041 RepID=A0ABV8REG6_9SPHN
MDMQNLTYALLGGLAIALMFTIYSDIRHRKIYNFVTLAIVLAAPVYWYASGQLGWQFAGMQIATAIVTFGIFSIFFALNWMKGGDVKLFSALALWFSLTKFITLVLVASVLGLFVTIFFAVSHKMRKRKGPALIPYGIAISLAGIWAVSEPFFNHFG